MKMKRGKSVNPMILFALIFMSPAWLAAQTGFSHIVAFGASLSDPGNAFALTGLQVTPPYNTLDSLLVPPVPYAKGGHHFSNGATWIEQFAQSLGLAADAASAFRGSGSNYAVGGARAHEDGINFNLSVQVNRFLQDVGGVASPDALYALEFGGNDIRDVLVSQDPTIIGEALGRIGENIYLLYQSGARKFLVWNVPDIGLSPAVRILDQVSPGAAAAATYFSYLFNEQLGYLSADLAQLPGIEIVLFDANQVLNDLVGDPESFGLVEVEEACVMPGRPPFQCKEPDDYLFWDGIHPTRAVHAILALDAARTLAQP
jgi:phospholipase/lecithinase/hemolysin